MLLNEHTAIIGQRVVLVPYRKEHVETYHAWMKSPELLEATASEPLSLEEEYAMQEKWRVDEDKLTFIVLARPNDGRPTDEVDISRLPMVGDVNMFLPDGPTGDVECEIMIADPAQRGRHLAREALSLLLHYATSPPPAGLGVPPANLIARMRTDNNASARLFEGLGFALSKRIDVFEQLEMRWREGGAAWMPAGRVVEYRR